MLFIWIAIAICSLWLLLLTVFFLNLYGHYNRLLHGSTQKTLQGLLEKVLTETFEAKKDIEMLQKRCDTIDVEGKFHIQKIGLIRFNPFKDTGGDQSFIMALIDGHDNGIVISGLYSRTGTRWYAKKIEKGIGVDHELSNEEKESVRVAKGTNIKTHEK